MTRATDLISGVQAAERELAARRASLAAFQRDCKHQFGQIRYTPHITEAYRTEGDPPGTMGIDRQMPVYVPRTETRKWARTCPLCGITQETTHTKKRSRSGSIEGTTGEEEVPDFPEPR